jgi:probable HAF family extracellular repeat protein
VALLMNERGQVAGISYTSSTPNPSGVPTVDSFVWDQGKMTDLGSFGGTFTEPGWLNERGQIVGFSNLPGDATAHPFLWSRAEGLKDLGTLEGTFGLATWINEGGEVVGSATTQGDQVQFAFLWKDGVMRGLGTVAGDACSVAFNINSRGQVVGSSVSADNCFGDSGHAFLWEHGGPMIDLNDFVPPDANLTLTQGDFINDRGEILVTGMLSNGDLRTVLLIPCDEEHGDREGCEDQCASAGVVRHALPSRSLSRETSRLPRWQRMSHLRFPHSGATN